LECGTPVPLLRLPASIKSGRGLPQSKAACGGDHNPSLLPQNKSLVFAAITPPIFALFLKSVMI
jgi:hypothetical protein